MLLNDVFYYYYTEYVHIYIYSTFSFYLTECFIQAKYEKHFLLLLVIVSDYLDQMIHWGEEQNI